MIPTAIRTTFRGAGAPGSPLLFLLAAILLSGALRADPAAAAARDGGSPAKPATVSPRPSDADDAELVQQLELLESLEEARELDLLLELSHEPLPDGGAGATAPHLRQ